MGTDIHMMVERKIGAAWVPYPWPTAEVYNAAVERNYALFGILAGVREDSPDGMVPLGLPQDFSCPTVRQVIPPGLWIERHEKLLNEPVDSLFLGDHSYSYMAVDTVAYLVNKHKKLRGCCFALDALPWLMSLGDPDKVRIVFGFDS